MIHKIKLEETYMKEIDKENEILIVSFTGNKEDIHMLLDYAKYELGCKTSYYNTDYEMDALLDLLDDIDCGGCCCEECEECEKENGIDTTEEDLVNHPPHYTNSGMECILEMVMLYGFEETMSFCKLNAHKYRKRALDKGGRMDMDKSDWYVNEYKELLYAKEIDMTPLEYVLSRMN